jgi:hypothetical protein
VLLLLPAGLDRYDPRRPECFLLSINPLIELRIGFGKRLAAGSALRGSADSDISIEPVLHRPGIRVELSSLVALC